MIKVRELPKLRAAAVEAEALIPDEHKGNLETRMHTATLPGASLWWASDDMTQLAIATAGGLPAWTPAIVRPEPTGFMAWTQPIGQVPSVEEKGFWLDGAPTEGVLASGLVQAVHWSIAGELLNFTFYGRVPDASQRARTQPVWHDFYEIGVYSTLSEHEFHPDHLQLRDRPVHDILHVVGASWLLMQQPTVAEPKTVPASKPRGNVSPPPTIDDVQVINLRRLTHDKTEPGTQGQTRREYRHRWLVRGHWRQQRVGPGRKFVRPVYVSPHIRGPEDAPLKTERVHKWNR